MCPTVCGNSVCQRKPVLVFVLVFVFVFVYVFVFVCHSMYPNVCGIAAQRHGKPVFMSVYVYVFVYVYAFVFVFVLCVTQCIQLCPTVCGIAQRQGKPYWG